MNGPIDAELLGRLLDEHGAGLALYASQWTPAADDCVQEALVELARQAERPRNPVAWLYRVVKHRALNAARGDRRRREREEHVMVDRFTMTQTATGTFERADTLAVVEALHRLGSDERELVMLRIWGGLKYEEIAESLAIPVSSAHRKYEQALTKLRKILESPCPTSATQNETN